MEPDINHAAIMLPLADVAADNAAKIQLWAERAKKALDTSTDAPDSAVLEAGLADLKATGGIFQGVYRAVIALIIDRQMSRKTVQSVATRAGFPVSRVSEFCRLAFGPETIRKEFVEGKATYRAALRSVREAQPRLKKPEKHVAPQKELIASNPVQYDVVKFIDANGVERYKVTLVLAVECPLIQPINILPEGSSGPLRWDIRVGQI